MDHHPSTRLLFSSFRGPEVEKFSPGFASTLLLLHSRIKRDFRPPKIGNRTSRYFTPWNGPNPNPPLPLCTKPWNKVAASSLLRQKMVLFSSRNSGIFWVEWTPDITSSTKPKILSLSAVFRFCYAAADRWKSETDLTRQKVLESSLEFMLDRSSAISTVQFSDWTIVIDFFGGGERGGDKRKGGIDIGSLNIFLGNRRWNRIENRRSESIVFDVEKFINI